MKSINRNGEVLEDSGHAFEQSMDKARGKVMWFHVSVCFVVGGFAASGLYIGLVAFVNWVMQ